MAERLHYTARKLGHSPMHIKITPITVLLMIRMFPSCCECMSYMAPLVHVACMHVHGIYMNVVPVPFMTADDVPER